MEKIGAPALDSQEPADARATRASLAPDPTEECHEIRDVDAGGVPCRLYLPEPGETLPGLVVFFHGGGWVIGDLDSHDNICRSLTNRSNHAVLSVDYRLAPEHPFPAALDDAIAAYELLTSSGYPPENIALVGDSSGGGLVLGTLVALRDRGEHLPATAVCICPWTDLSLSGGSIETNAATDPMVQAANLAQMADAYLGAFDRRTPTASPLFADLTGLPPLLVQAGKGELLVDDATRVAEHATAQGVEVTLEVWDDVFHVWHSFADILPEAREAIERIGEHVDRHLGSARRADGSAPRGAR
jgi:acetyl esterase/lipase